MCGLMSSPSVTTPPPAPTVTDATTDNDIRARERARKNLRGAVNTGTSMLSGGTSMLSGSGSDRGKSLLGQ